MSTMWFKKDSRGSTTDKSKIKRQKVVKAPSKRDKDFHNQKKQEENVEQPKEVPPEIVAEETKPESEVCPAENATVEDGRDAVDGETHIEENVEESTNSVEATLDNISADSGVVSTETKSLEDESDVVDGEYHEVFKETNDDLDEEVNQTEKPSIEDDVECNEEDLPPSTEVSSDPVDQVETIHEDIIEEREDNESDNITSEKDISPIPDVVVIPEIIIDDIVEDEEVNKDNDVELRSTAVVLTDSECPPDGQKKPKTKHRKTMSLSSTIELVRSFGDECLEAAKREIEHSRKKEYHKKKEHGCERNKPEHNDTVTLILYDASVGETDDFELAVETDFHSKKNQKKKDQKEPHKTRKISAVSMMNAQKNTVKKLAKASSVSALNFIRSKKKPNSGGSLEKNPFDHAIVTTELFLENERVRADVVKESVDNDIREMPKLKEKSPSVEKATYEKVVIRLRNDMEAVSKKPDTSSCDEEDEEVYYDAKSLHEEPIEQENHVKVEQPRLFKTTKSKRSIGGSLKRTGGGKRRTRKKSVPEEPPPLPPRAPLVSAPAVPQPALFKQPNIHQRHSNWLFGNSFKDKGDSRRDDDAGADSVSQMTDSSHFSSEHSAERSDSNAQSRNGSGIAARPVTRAESYRDRADRVKRTKRKTSDPNQLTSNKDFPDMEVLGAAGGPAVPSGGSSNSSLSSKSNDSMQPDNEGSQSEWSEEEDCGGPWSARAAPELIASMSGIARKRQDLIHELIWSECSHVRWLRVLRRVYLSPLRRAGASLLPPAELHSLLPNLPDVLSRHKRLAAELRALQNGTIATAVPTRPVAEALVSMLGESKYSCALARFCGGQGLALDALRERRKRNKDLNAFLLKSEQDPLCVRLRLQDLLACVWQRLTKYQLLLEGIMKTATAEELSGSGNNNSGAEGGADSGDDFSRVAYALDLAKDVLNTVNTAIKTTENEHRLKSIQSKLEVRVSEAVEVGELRKFDLSRHSLVMEGTLSIRQDSNKRVNILALLLRECMVLLHTDGDRYILKAIPQATHQPLSPIIHWSMMLFRNNAAVKNGFFLVNINGLQMYEFSAASSAEYNTWAKHLSEAATALEAKHGATEEGPPPPIPSNTSSAATTPENIPNGTPDAEVDAAAATSNHQGPDTKQPDNEDDGNQVNGAEVSVVSEEEAGISGPNLGGDSKMDSSLLDPALLTVTQPPLTMVATVEITPQERLRRAEEKVKSALLEAAEASRELWGPRPLLRAPLDHLVGTQDAQLDTEDTAQQLISQAQEHMNTLTMVVLRALRVSPASCLGSKCPSHSGEGLCDQCADLPDRNSNGNTAIKDDGEETMDSIVLEKVGESSTDPTNECEVSLAGVRDCGRGLRGTLAQLEVRLAAMEAEREMLRAQLQRADHRIHHMHQLHKDCIHIETPVKLEINEGNSINNSSNDHSSGPG